MSMITRCPACGTAFRVAPEQLQMRQGTVRCGRCATVFDGFRSLARDDDAARPELPPAVPAAAPPAPEPPEPAPAPSVPEPAAVERPPEPFEPPPAEAEVVVELPQAAMEPARRRGNAVWGFGIVLTLLALGAQAVYFYRGDIAVYVPEMRPYLDRMCAELQCTVALAQRPRSITIEASDLQATDPANPGLIVLTATLRNHATMTTGYPALDIVLTNAKEHTVARRIFLPAEYLDASKDVRAGVAPNAEMTIRLDIDSGDLGAAGFRLDLLPAPRR